MLLYFKCSHVLKSFGCVVSSINSSSFARICFSVVSLSSILAKRLIATLKYYKGILEIWLKLIFSNLEARFSAIWGVGRQKTWWCMWKWIGTPLTNIWDQSSPKLASTLFAGLPYARNRSLDWDLFCGGSNARLPTTSLVHKMDSRPGIIIYAASHLVFAMKCSPLWYLWNQCELSCYAYLLFKLLSTVHTESHGML